jgi:cytochrome c-type biogenesis protein CcmH/NrfF
MLHCHSADPKRQRIHELQSKGMSDDQIVGTFVREEGVVALSSPSSGSLGGLITWVMPGLMLLLGFYIYMRYVRGNRQAPAPISVEDQALLDRYRGHLGDDD